MYLPYMGMAAILIKDRDHLFKFIIPLSQKVLHDLKKICPGLSKEKSLKGVDGRRTDDDGQWTASDHNVSS